MGPRGLQLEHVHDARRAQLAPVLVDLLQLLSELGVRHVSNAQSFHPAGVNTLFADGSVKCIKSSIASNIWWGLGTVANGEVISADQY